MLQTLHFFRHSPTPCGRIIDFIYGIKRQALKPIIFALTVLANVLAGLETIPENIYR